MKIISSREFRANQRAYFDRIDSGEEIIVQRKGNKSYKIVPIKEDDTIYTQEELVIMVNDAVKEYKAGRTKTMYPGESLDDFLERTKDV